MFGKALDYQILRLFTHSRNLKTEEELNSSGVRVPSLAVEDANLRLRKLVGRLEGNLPISDARYYLDIGCGAGDIAIALAKAGCKHVTGIDFVPRSIEQARLNAKQFQVDDSVDFVCDDVHQWIPPQQYDVVISHEALEHIENPRALLKKIGQLVVPNGVVILAFGPLFHSPVGDHMSGFFRVQIPWRGVIFSEKAMLQVRRECYRPTDYADRYQDINGGLNLMRYTEFLEDVDATGWEFRFLSINPQLKRFPPLHQLSNILVQIPLVRDYFASSVYAILSRKSSLDHSA